MRINIRFIVPKDNIPGDLTGMELSQLYYRFSEGKFAGQFAGSETFVILCSPHNLKYKYYEVNVVRQD